MNTLNRKDLLKRKKLEPVPVDLPDGRVFVRIMTAGEKEQYERLCQDKTSGFENNIRASLVLFTLCDQQGNLMFNPDELNLIADMPMPMIKPIFEAALSANGMAKDSVDKAEKN